MTVECAAMVKLIIKDESGERSVDLVDTQTVIGRAPEVRLVIGDKESSRRHCQVEKVDAGYKLVDLESRNGTRVNGKFVNQHLLRPGDVIQIGKTTLTFHDPDYREPPAEDLLRFAAASAPAPAPMAPPPAPVLLPEPAVAQAEPPPERKRSGHTTAIGRRSRVESLEQAKEAQTLKLVGILVGLFVFVLIALVVAGAVTGESPTVAAGRQKYEAAMKVADANPRQAINLLSEIQPNAGKWYGDAQKKLESLRGSITTDPGSTSTPEEEAAIGVLFDKHMEAAGRSTFADEIIRMCGEFKQKYPRSKFMPQCDEYLSKANESKTAVKGNEVDEMERDVAGFLKTNDYGPAVAAINKVYAKYKTDLDVRPKLQKRLDDVVAEGVKYFDEQVVRARLLEKTQPEMAKQLYRDLIIKLGDGKVEELKGKCQIANGYLEKLKQ